MDFCYRKINIDGKGLTKAYYNDAGFDLYSSVSINLEPGVVYSIATNVAPTYFPPGTYGRVAEKSGLALKGIRIGGGVIDEGFRDEIKCIVTVLDPIEIKKDQKIAQLIIEKHHLCNAVEETEDTIPIETLSITEERKERGMNGFGSSGLFDTPNFHNGDSIDTE